MHPLARMMGTTRPDAQRSRIMRAVKGKDTKPEWVVRRLVHALGYRYRLHRKDLPGKPDLVFGPRRKVIFVHGCFWHGHHCKRGARVPKTNRDYWVQKVQRNRDRDTATQKALQDAGWSVLILWECEIKDTIALEQRLITFLN